MPKINPRIKSIDDLLGLDAAEESPIEPTPSVSLPTKNTIITLPPQAIRAFRGHPFRLYEGDRLNDLVESISEHGVLNPAIIRKIERDEDGFEYEMLAGHNRQNAAAIANRELPCMPTRRSSKKISSAIWRKGWTSGKRTLCCLIRSLWRLSTRNGWELITPIWI